MTACPPVITLSPTVTITRTEFRGLCDAQLLLAGACREQLQIVQQLGNKRTRDALSQLVQSLQIIENHLRATTGG